jgi:hypothetical protein
VAEADGEVRLYRAIEPLLPTTGLVSNVPVLESDTFSNAMAGTVNVLRS